MIRRTEPNSNHGTHTRARERRQRTVSVSLSDRGQTTQDFAVGIGVFILAVAFVFAFLPSIVTPYDSSVGGAETAQADRIADRALEELSSGDAPNDLEESKITDSDWENEDELAKTFGLRTADSGNILVDRLNVSVYRLDGEDPVNSGSPDDTWAFGSDYGDQAAASSARIVTVDNGSEPAYRLVVRVW